MDIAVRIQELIRRNRELFLERRSEGRPAPSSR
jgi:hypothetical protein